MADAVTATILQQGQDKLTLHLTNRSDATGEAAVSKLTLANILNMNGLPCVRTGILESQWSIQGFSSVTLAWAHTTPDVAEIMATGNGYRDYRDTTPKMDPQSAGGTGNLTLTTFGAAANATYDILLVLALRFAA
jgi:hypothetical protein